MRNKAALIALSSALLALAACQTDSRRVELPPQPQGIEGRWASVAGPVQYTALLSGGRFTSTETATGALLADGSYTNLGPGQISIIYTSQTTSQRVAANCNQVETNRLSCATSSGGAFDLVRV